MAPGEITRAMVVAEIKRLEQAQRPGAAEYFRKSAATFLNWMVDLGAITASPMAGYGLDFASLCDLCVTLRHGP